MTKERLHSHRPKAGLCIATRILPFAPIDFAAGASVSRADSSMPSDADGCKDFCVSRLAGYNIADCAQSDFDLFVFADGQSAHTTVEGKIVHDTHYQPAHTAPNSKALVNQNSMNALRANGSTVVYEDRDSVVAKQIKNGAERWVLVDGNGGSYYMLHLAKQAGMQQSVVTADDMSTALNRNGRISLRINFDTGRSTIKPDSLPMIDQIAATMKGNGALQISVEGNTDNLGEPQSNLVISRARAQSVVGHGQEDTVADNSTEDGRAENRRVDLVKK